MRRLARDLLRRVVRRAGYDIVRHGPDPMSRAAALLGALDVDLVLDVGANRGQYYRALRASGFRGDIVSFEPNPDAYAELRRAAARDSRWRGLPLALGRKTGAARLNVTRNSEFSSFHAPRPDAGRVDGGLAVVEARTVAMRPLATLWDDELRLAHCRPFLKLDVQGFELEVLEGAGDHLAGLAGIQVEVALERLYHSQPALWDVLPYLSARGFTVHGVLEGYRDQASGALVEVDLLMVNRVPPSRGAAPP